MKLAVAVVLLSAFNLNQVCAQPAGKTTGSVTYPMTPRTGIAEEHFGQKVSDPYRWLEQDAADDTAIATWVANQKALTDEYLEGLPGRDVFQYRISELMNYDRYTAPKKRGDRYFFSVIKGIENRSSLYVQDGVAGTAKPLINPSAWLNASTYDLGSWDVSDDGRHVAFSLQKQGANTQSIKVLDVGTGEELDDMLEGSRFTGLTWAPDGSGFFYAATSATEAVHGETDLRSSAVYFHRIGTPQSDDRLVYSTPDKPKAQHRASREFGKRYLTVSSTVGGQQNALSIIDLESKDWNPKAIVSDTKFSWMPLGNVKSKLFVATTDGADRGRIVSFDLDGSFLRAEEVVSEAKDGAVLDSAVFTGKELLVGYRVDAKSELRRFNMQGKLEGQVSQPGIGSARFSPGSGDEHDAFFVFTSYNVPVTIYRYDTEAKTVSPWAVPETPIVRDEISVEQHFYSSRDGTQVPLYVVRRKDVKKPAPTLLHGYGAFGRSQTPIFNPVQLAWVEQGGMLAIAGIRGGGEYGEQWHADGKLDRKQNGFDDFIAAGEYLKRTGLTAPNGLAIQGESAGGLLVATVSNQRPDLFDAALPTAAVLDMARYDKLNAPADWKDEYGDPANKDALQTMLMYSPYHNIKTDAAYPAILASSAGFDPRASQAHTFKYIAALQAANLGPKPHLLLVEASSAPGNPMAAVIKQYADKWAFAAFWTGLKVE
ncbi:prolyl oligopeptidase family serine peptidase [Agrobacterium cavarae]|uniref:prolyl oligopeptidase family serine peptidase n=1 Tax=Agrobacterium cavarae TaxID=2528239 RepID=UPI003FD171EB